MAHARGAMSRSGVKGCWCRRCKRKWKQVQREIRQARKKTRARGYDKPSVAVRFPESELDCPARLNTRDVRSGMTVLLPGQRTS
jgi:hypothetical protein